MATSDEYEEEQQDLDPQQLQDLLDSYGQVIEKANTTIVNLLRNEPLLYMEVAESAVVQNLQKERALWEQENFRLKDKQRAIREIVSRAAYGAYKDVDALLAALHPILRGTD